MTDDADSESRHELSRMQESAPPAPPESPPGRPPRPAMTTGAPPPIPPIEGPSRPMRTARWLWALSFLAGIVALVVVVLRRTDQFGRVRDWIEELFPDYEAETVDRVAAAGFWVTFGVLALFLLIELMLRPRTERSAVARWGMLLALLLHASAAFALMSFVALGAEGTSTQLLIVAQLALAAVALLVTTVAAVVSRRRQRRQPQEPAPRRR